MVVRNPAPNNHFACPFYASLTALAKFPGVAVRQPPSFSLAPLSARGKRAIVLRIVAVFFGMRCHGVSAIKHALLRHHR